MSSSIRYADAAIRETDALCRQLGTDARRGLAAGVRRHRLETQGPNAIPRESASAFKVFLRQIRSPFIWLLGIAAGIAILTGETTDAAMIALFIIVNVGLGFAQEYRAERAVEALMEYWEGKTHVRIDGALTYVPSRDLVPGDVIRLQAGDKIPADVRFIATTNLSVDESILTGESQTVSKDDRVAPKPPRDYYEATNVGFSGTLVLTGESDAVVVATGPESSLGGIAALAAEAQPSGAFEKEISSFSAFILKLVLVTLAFVFALNLGLKGMGHIEELILFSIALTVGVIPEALPVVSTIALSRGAMRMAKKNVVVKRLAAINDLGSIDVLCTDKTGTVTKNEMHVAGVLAADPDECTFLALLASSFLGENERQQNNAFDRALWTNASAETRQRATRARKIAEIPFDPVRRRNTVLVALETGERICISRGSPDDLVPLTSGIGDQIALGRHLAEQGLAGRRALAVAARRNVDERADIAEADRGLAFSGVISFEDPLKTTAAAAAKRAAELGVQLKILTGDSKEVAGAVAVKLGLIDDPLAVMSGAEFDALGDAGRHDAVATHHVFARVNPTQKFAILELLKEKSVVGFLGEGFNDAPGLKIAHVGLAVAGASDVAKEAADVILLNQSLSVICDGIEEGRRTYANTVKYLKATLAGNFGNFYSVAAASLFIDFLPMLPLQILLVNMLTDLPMIAIAADTVDAEDLRKPGRHDSRHIVLHATMLGIVSSLFDFTTFAIFLPSGQDGLRTMWFIVSILTELALIWSIRTSKFFLRGSRPPASIAVLTVAAVSVTLALPLTAIGKTTFHFSTPTSRQLVIAALITVSYLAATEVVKRWLKNWDDNAKRHAIA